MGTNFDFAQYMRKNGDKWVTINECITTIFGVTGKRVSKRTMYRYISTAKEGTDIHSIIIPYSIINDKESTTRCVYISRADIYKIIVLYMNIKP